jgi:predicted permease
VNTFLQDLRYALRSLLKNPSLTLAAVLSLALGIGANTTVFTWVQAILLRPIPGAADPDRLLAAVLENREGQQRSWSYPNYRDYRDRATLADAIAQGSLPMSLSVDGQAERAYGAIVSGNYFQVLGIQPAAGRLLTPEDDRTKGGHPVAVISHAYWVRRFAASPSIVGKDVIINSTPMTIVGVSQPGFLGSFLGVAASAFVPMAMQPQMAGSDRLDTRGSSWMQTLVRLRPGATQDQAQAEASTIMGQLDQEYRTGIDGRGIRVVVPWQAPFGAPNALAPILGVLSVVVALVLLIACANVANLLLSRAVGRRREIAIRVSLGANRWRLVRQLLTESLLLSLAAGAGGVAMAYWTSGVLMAFAPPTDLPIDFSLRVNTVTLAYAFAVSVVTGVLFGLAPALQASRPRTVDALKEEAGRGSGGRTGHRLRGALVVAQVAVCVVLLIGATLFVRSLQAAQDIDTGFDRDGVLIASFDLFPNGYTPDTGRQLQHRLAEVVGSLPGVDAFAFGRIVPLGIGGSSQMGTSIDGYTPGPDEQMSLNYNIVGPRYFETMKIAIARGREFTAADTRESQRVLIVNETMANMYWRGRDPIGARVRTGGEDYRVVGIAKDIKYQQIAERPRPFMYLPLDQYYTSSVVMHVRTRGEPGAMLAAVRDAVRSVDPNLPLFDARTLNEHLKAAVFAQTMGANLLGAMGMLALLLAAVGLYGVIAYAVSQRTQEMGIRLALGAAPRDLLRMIVRQGLTLTAVGLGIGLALAFAVTGVMTSLLPGITPRDPLTFIAVPAVLLAVAAGAALIPARRAGSTDPVVALRYQ